MARRIAVRGIIFKNGRLFCLEQKRSDGTINNFWSTPGGGLDENEGIVDGLTREIIEETGVAPVVGNLLFVQQYLDDHKEQLEFFFHIKNADDFENVDLSNTSHGEVEIERCAFIDPKLETILPAFLGEVELPATHETYLPTKLFSYL
ncbi:MAG: NUDIX domain-containing protein [Solirubrobacterales bacterium]